MKRLSLLMLSFALMACLIPAARADVLWTPDNQFFEKHEEDCTYVGRSYRANGVDGFVTLWDAPGGHTVAAQYENGFTLPVYWQYEDWGCVTVWGDERTVNGWVPMADLSLIYDHISFEEEYGAQFRDYAGEFSDYEPGAEEIACWEYPGAPKPKWTLPTDDRILSALTGSGQGDSYFSQVFTDENGLNWGYVAYLYGQRSFWICLDDPAGTDVSPRVVDQDTPIPPQAPRPPAVSALPYVLVGGVVLVTAALLAWFYVRRRGPSGGAESK